MTNVDSLFLRSGSILIYMTHEKITSISHIIQLGDSERMQEISFDLAELKTLQGIIIDRIKHDAEVDNAAYLPHRELVAKLEYFITNLTE